MSITADDLARRLEEEPPEPDAPVDDRHAGPDGPERDGTSAAPDETAEEELRIPMVAGAAALSGLAAAWMVSGLFRDGWTPRLIAVLGVVIGVGLSWLSARGTGRRGALQVAVVPVAVVVGAALVAPDATGGTASLPGLVSEALRGGGLLQPPVPFEPGWRFLLVVLFAAVGATAVGLALSLRRPRLAVVVPLPLVIGGALLQPEGGELVAAGVAGLLAIAALALAFGADLPTDDGAGTRFETRRLARGGALLVVLVAALALVARAGFLFPDPATDRVIPPQRPPTPPAEPDRVLFTVEGDQRGPWRVGVLDEYDGEAFLLPPIDPARIRTLDDDGAIEPAGDAETYTVGFTIADVRGATLPAPAAPVRAAAGSELEYDPRTQVLRLASGRPPKGFEYEVEAASSPDGRTLAEAAPATSPEILAFREVPPAPNEVVTLLTDAPEAGFDRLQFLRQRLYNNVVATGGGTPVPIPPSRVGEMLRPGAEASPYEITAAEVLLARWAGVPARLGFGFYGGEDTDGATEFRPRHGAAWLEAHFEGHGWVPLVGTPPRAKASISEEMKNEDPSVLATQELAMVVFVPVELTTIELLYQQVRYWAGIVLPLLALAGIALGGWPAAAKALRRWRRQRWAAERGPVERIWAAYAELRDTAYDLNIGELESAPLEFLGAIEPDAEHEELAWLVTRAVWGDLRRDVRHEDADAAEEMARSVTRRLASAQTPTNRLLGTVSKASLVTPYTRDIPDLWLRLRPSPDPIGSRRERVRQRVLRPSTVLIALLAVAIVAAPFIVPESEASAQLPGRYPDPLLPAQVGPYELVREQEMEQSYGAPGPDALVEGGQVHSIRDGSLVAGSHQVAVFRDDIDARDRAVQRDVERSILTGTFVTRRFGPVRLRELRTPEQQVYLWFPPSANVMQLWIFRADVDDARDVVERIVAHQLGLPHPPEGASR